MNNLEDRQLLEAITTGIYRSIYRGITDAMPSKQEILDAIVAAVTRGLDL